MEYVLAIGLLIAVSVVIVAVGIVFVMGLLDRSSRREDPVEYFLADKERTAERRARRAL